MILSDYHRFHIHPDRIKKIEKFISKNDLTCKISIFEES